MTGNYKAIFGIFGAAAIALVVGLPAAQAQQALPERSLGNPKAPVVLVEYGSPTCPHCAAFYKEGFATLKANYIDTGKVRYVFRVFLLRADDGAVEKLARCLPADRYFDFLGQLYQKQPVWDAAVYPNIDMEARLLEMAAGFGLGKDRGAKCLRDPALNTALNQVSDEATAKYAINGTPAFLVNGVPGQVGEMWPHLQQRLMAALAAK